MNFKELISKRRACKLFNDKKINEKDLHFILESGVLAVSVGISKGTYMIGGCGK